MNRIKSLLIVSVILLMTACSDKNAELINMVPNDAAFVVSINPKSLVSKSGITFKDGKVNFPSFVDPAYAEKMMSGENETIKDVLNAGIDYETNIFLFSSNIGSEEFALVARIKDAKAFDEFIKKQNTGVEITRDGDLSYFNNGGAIIAFNDNILYIAGKTVMVNEEDQINAIKQAFTGKIKSLAENKAATEALAESNDMNMYVNYAKLFESMGKYAASYNPMMVLAAIPEIEIVGSLNFNKEDAVLNAKNIIVKETEYTKLMKEAVGKPNSDFLKLMPETFDCFLSFSIKGDKLAEDASLKKLINERVKNPIASNQEIMDLIASIDGPVSIGFNSASTMNGAIDGTLSIKTKKPEMILSLIQRTIDSVLMGVPKVATKNGYSVSAFGISVEYGKVGDFVYLTTSGIPEKSAYSNGDIEKFFSKMITGFYVNADKSTSLSAMIAQNTGMNINGTVTGGAFNSEDASFKLTITDPKQENVLQTLMFIFSKMYINR